MKRLVAGTGPARYLAADVSVCAGVAICAALVFVEFRPTPALPPPELKLEPSGLLADGYDTATLSIHTSAAATPQISFSGAPGLRIDKISGSDGNWRARIRAGIVPGNAEIRVSLPGAKSASLPVELRLATRDSAEDGTPDFLRLEDEHDRQAFRQWFTFLAEAQYFQDPASRPKEIDDCAALIRYAYREALLAHDGTWAASTHLPFVPALEGITKYSYPFTPLGAALFRTKPGPFRAADLETAPENSAFLQFADARTLWRYNSHLVSRDLARAQPGDLLFYHHPEGREPFHSMIYLGASQLQPDAERYVLYHTGPDGNDPGEIKRLTVSELMQFPQPEWRPTSANPAFLGVAQWNILRRNVE